MRNLILTGFMGTGKTTVGRLLARRYGLQLVDTDAEVERLTGRTVADIFARDGEEHFRELETRVLSSALQGSSAVIASGGGTLLSPSNRALLYEDDSVMCLTCEPDTLAHRIGKTGERPLFDHANPTAVQTLLAQRESVYALFPRIDTTHRSPLEVADEIVRLTRLERAASFRLSPEMGSQVLFGEGLMARTGELVKAEGMTGQVLVVTDERLAGLSHLETLRSSLRDAGLTVTECTIPPGEEHKTLATMEAIYGAALEAHLDRSAVAIGLGGGVVGDLTGLLAATYLRGLRLVLLPTTLLAQVDAAIGGKVGIDFRGTKNMIGAFKPAELVLIDPCALATLPPPALSDGVAEMIKIGFMRSRRLVTMLEEMEEQQLLEHPHAIRLAAELKVDVVRADPFERGERMLLNFGHTIGHGIEAASEYAISHGRAVSMGMVWETRLAVARGWCDRSVLDALLRLLRRFSLPTEPADVDLEAALPYVAQDKKRHAGKIRLAVPGTIGEGRIVELELDDLRSTRIFAEPS